MIFIVVDLPAPLGQETNDLSFSRFERDLVLRFLLTVIFERLLLQPTCNKPTAKTEELKNLQVKDICHEQAGSCMECR